MEEDIKILEEMKKDIVYDSDEDYDNKIAIRQIQAIENLIKGYRELEKRIIQLTNLLCINDSDENYIPKSKIKEKMEELKKEVKDYKCEENRINLYQRKILQELMEDK